MRNRPAISGAQDRFEPGIAPRPSAGEPPRRKDHPSTSHFLRSLLSAQAGPTCVCDLVGHFELSQPTISHHLKTLREAGLLTATKVGIWSFYALDPSAPELLESLPALALRAKAS